MTSVSALKAGEDVLAMGTHLCGCPGGQCGSTNSFAELQVWKVLETFLHVTPLAAAPGAVCLGCASAGVHASDAVGSYCLSLHGTGQCELRIPILTLCAQHHGSSLGLVRGGQSQWCPEDGKGG